MSDLSNDARAIIESIQDLTRVTLALQGDFASRSDAIRRLHELSIPSGRIASILAMSVGDVTSAIAKAKNRAAAAPGRAASLRKKAGQGKEPPNVASSSGADSNGE